MAHAHPLRLVVFVSGSGSNLQALLDLAKECPDLCQVVGVVASNDHCYALERARKAGVPTHVVQRKDYPLVPDYDQALEAVLAPYDADFLCLAGFMRLLSADFVAKWYNKILNVHPSLLPAFKGKEAIEQAVALGTPLIGCTVHVVRAEMDAGPILAQAVLNRLPGESMDALKERLHQLEHACFRAVVQALATKELRIEADQVTWQRPVEARTLMSW